LSRGHLLAGANNPGTGGAPHPEQNRKKKIVLIFKTSPTYTIIIFYPKKNDIALRKSVTSLLHRSTLKLTYKLFQLSSRKSVWQLYKEKQ